MVFPPAAPMLASNHPHRGERSMLRRIALFIASLAAAATLAVSAVALGLWPPAQPVAIANTAAIAATTPAPSPSPQVDTIYVAPPAPRQTITVHKVVSGGGGGDGGREGSSDD